MDGQTARELTSAEYLSSQLKGIFIHKLEILVATAKAYQTDESPTEGRKLADLIVTLENATKEAGADRLLTILPLLLELVTDSLVELIADNNRRLLGILGPRE